MAGLSFCLFGKFSVKCGDRSIKIPNRKLQELLAYLLVHRNRPHSREFLAETVWGNAKTEKSKKHLRQALWLLHSLLDAHSDRSVQTFVLTDADWVQINRRVKFGLDVAEFESTAAEARGKTIRQIDGNCAAKMEEAVKLYVGDLLEDNYQDWCFYERERLQNIYLMLLDKLTGYYCHAGFFDKGLFLAYKILTIDCTHEKTHRQIMRLQYLSGNRPAALKQYEKCAEHLKRELDVRPDKRTTGLYEQLRNDTYGSSPGNEDELMQLQTSSQFSLSGTVRRLKKIDAIINKIQKELRRELEIVESTLNS